MLDQAAAAALFAIVVTSTSGLGSLAKQKPLHVEDRGDAFLVVGSPYTVGHFFSCFEAHVSFAKLDAKVLGIGTDARLIVSKADEARPCRTASQMRDAFTAKASDWKRDGVDEFARELAGGVVNTPADAVAYAKVLLRGTPHGAVLAQGLLNAVERDKVWHVARAPDTADIMTISRTTGQRLSPLP